MATQGEDSSAQILDPILPPLHFPIRRLPDRRHSTSLDPGILRPRGLQSPGSPTLPYGRKHTYYEVQHEGGANTSQKAKYQEWSPRLVGFCPYPLVRHPLHTPGSRDIGITVTATRCFPWCLEDSTSPRLAPGMSTLPDSTSEASLDPDSNLVQVSGINFALLLLLFFAY